MRHQALKPFQHRGFRLLVGGQLASNVGDAFYAVALPWYVLELHAGALRLGELLADDDLQAGNAISSGGTQLAMLVGPALGGAAVALVGPAPAFGVDALSFMVSALSLMALRGAHHAESEASGPGTADAGADARTLWQFIRGEPLVPLLFAVNVAANLGSGGMSEVALPALARGPFHAGATGYGLLIACFAGGAVVGTLIAAQTPSARKPAIVATCGFLGDALFLAATPYVGGAIPAAAALLCCGLLNSFSNVLTATAFQRWAPRHLLGRLTGISLLGSFGIFPVSVFIAGVVVHASGPAIFMPLAGATLAVTLLFALTRPEWRSFGERQADLVEA